jgi:hypothetical protein
MLLIGIILRRLPPHKGIAVLAKKVKTMYLASRPIVEGRQPSIPKTPTNALYKKCIKLNTTRNATPLSVEPVLRTVLDRKRPLNTLTRLGRRASRSVHPVNLLVIALDSIELQPRNATHVVRSRRRILWRSALDRVGQRLYVAVVCLSAQIKRRDLLGVEVVVARDAFCGLGTSGDGVVERESGDVGHDAAVEARGVACCVEEGGDCAVGDGDGVGGRGGAGVVLGAPADGDVLE